MKPLPRVRLIQSWQTYSKGAFLWPDSAILRNWLIDTKRAVLDLETPTEITPASDAPKTSIVMARRGRPKKVVA